MKNKYDTTWMKKDLATNAIFRAVGMICNFLSIILLARLMDTTQFGDYTYIITLVSILSIPTQTGIPILITKESSIAYNNKNPSHIHALLIWSSKTVITITIILIMVMGTISLISYSNNSMIEIYILFIALTIVPLTAFTEIYSSILRGYRHTVIGQLPSNTIRPFLLLILLILTILYTPKYEFSATNGLIMFIMSCAITLIMTIIIYRRMIPNRYRIYTTDYLPNQPKNLTRSLIPLSLVSGMIILNQNIDILILGIISTSDNVAFYKISSQISSLVGTSLILVNYAISPHVSSLFYSGQLISLQRLITKGVKLSVITSILTSLAIVLISTPIVPIVFGEKYTVSIRAMEILILGQIVNVAFGSVATILNMTGHENHTIKVTQLTVSINILLNFLLIPYMGIEGAALATSISLTIWNAMLWYVVKQRLNIDTSIASLLG